MTFNVTATGSAPLGYRWQFNGQDTGGVATNFTVLNVQSNNAGGYRCLVTNSAGSATSAG